MSPQYNVDGEIVPAEEATVSVEDRGFQYGDGAFETLRAYGGDVFEWEAHADRLDRTCEALSLDHGLERAELRERIDETLAANEFDDAYVKCSITRGSQPGKLTPQPEVDPTVVVYAKELPRGGVDGDDVWDEPATLQTVKTRRMPDSAIPATAKTHNYLNGILARAELIETADEALLRDMDGAVVEGAASNVFFVHDDAVHTPSATRDLLPGITRRLVIDLAEDAGVPVRTGTYEPSDVREANEAFVTNTTWEVRPVDQVDGISVGGGAVTELLSRLFDELVEERHY
ncbi:branched chain amino acid aminotransferase [Salinarchaeum sp. Harcht-Bsk1]|uniref:aminotransferase class IV n=1 Tax=Salinarchaeum sp. Harcht-Bsk1 TaxID=1333523 RepID=UPI0003422DDE|nr:aminotransferase class IV [Salinarchaeum sp. Harcht-Bsk1]AGN02557.1 branched chain amino acid aminotransferase [Salinarchaeum sp. Harcht-Bsk1]